MQNSVFLLGADPEHRREVQSALGGVPVSRFMALAQRVIWGVSQPDLVRVDVDAVLRKLRWPEADQPLTHLLAACALRRVDPARAEAALEQARVTMGDDHPFRYLLPSVDEWTGRRPAQALHEVVPGRVWRIPRAFAPPTTGFEVVSVGTLIRTEAGGLVFVNPVALSDEVLAQVRDLGPLHALAVQGRAHSRFVERARQQFPEARVFLTSGHREHPASRHLASDGLLGVGSSSLHEEFVEFPVRGTLADEVVLLHVPTRLLIFQDLVSNNLSSNQARPFAGRLEYAAFGLLNRIGLLSYHPILWRDLRALQTSLGAIRESAYRQVTGAHWPIEPAHGASQAAFEAALDHVLGLSRTRHLAYVAEFFAHQPYFLRDLLLYSRKTKS